MHVVLLCTTMSCTHVYTPYATWSCPSFSYVLVPVSCLLSFRHVVFHIVHHVLHVHVWSSHFFATLPCVLASCTIMCSISCLTIYYILRFACLILFLSISILSCRLLSTLSQQYCQIQGLITCCSMVPIYVSVSYMVVHVSLC